MQVFPPEIRRLQVALALFGALWQGVNGWIDWQAGSLVYCGIELGIAAACVLVSVLLWRGQINLRQLGWTAMTLVFISLGVILVDDVLSGIPLSSYAYMNSTIAVGLAFTLFPFRSAARLALLVNSMLVGAALLTRQPSFTLLTGYLFISVLLAYAVFHNHYAVSTLSLRLKAERELEEMTSRDPVTGLMTVQGMHLHLRRQWPGLDDHERAYTALLAIQIANYPDIIEKHGHAAGNQVLQQLALHLMQIKELSDVSAKGEGPEFLMLLSNVKRKDVKARFELLKERLHGTLWVGGPALTLAAGSVQLAEVETPEQSIPQARERHLT